MEMLSLALLVLTLSHFGITQEFKASDLKVLCNLPSETGNCRAALPRWFFNSRRGRCEQFIYGGCGGNGNNFKTIEECEDRCDRCLLPKDPTGPCAVSRYGFFFNTTSIRCEEFVFSCYNNANNFQNLKECEARCDPCQLPSKTGLCEGSFPRWFFNNVTGKCEKFVYGGCNANANNFKTKQQCQQRCNLCELPSKPGPCEAYIPSWFYNSESGQCEEFAYGGCEGNANRFSSKNKCEKRCAENICTLPVEKGPCVRPRHMYAFNSTSGQCKPFRYGGCAGNGNRFTLAAHCNAACDVCRLPVKPGPCRASIPRYYFNYKNDKCEQFIYGGCQGNANNFNSEDDCARRCSICDYPKMIGPCRALTKRWYFNKNTNKCEMFLYGGCEGNANNFENQKECESSCRCMRPKDIGPCDGVFPKYYYNNGQCQLFDYGGCEGNGNRYETKSSCLSVCSTCKAVDCDNTYCPNGLKKNKNGCINKKCQCVCKCKGKKCRKEQCIGTNCNVCQLPPDSGCGKKKAIRWFYDASNNRTWCSQFRYSGKGGNGNNFKSNGKCQQACWVDK